MDRRHHGIGQMSNLKEIAGNLKASSQKLHVVDSSVKALELVSEVPSGYVWPNVRSLNDSEIAHVVLVIAAGAVGKSTAARALAAKLNWPLVDAAKAQVGSYSLSGLLHDALGFESSYMSDVATGKAGVVIDALDEGHLKAGTSNFQEFLENICKLAGSNHTSSSIILFSRPDTAEIVKLFLKESNTNHSVMQLDFFTYSQACDFLDSRLNELHQKHPEKDYGIAQQHPKAYAELRDLRLREIAQALLSRPIPDVDKEWAEVAEFLGYAPVLSVLAEYLAVPNPHGAVSRRLGTSTNSHEVLVQIVQAIMEREQLKFQNQVCAKLLAQLPATEEWPNALDSYSADEQSVRLVARNLGLDIKVSLPAMLPDILRQQYEQDAAQFTADHPFLAGTSAVNVVFADYLLAKAAADQGVQAAVSPSPTVTTDSVGPFFYNFVASFAPRTEDAIDSTVAVIPERLLAPLLESHRRAQIDPATAMFLYVQTNTDGFLFFEKVSAKGKSKNHAEYMVTDISGVTVFESTLSRGVVVTDGGVTLGEPSKRFILGPAVTLRCSELDIAAGSLSVDAAGNTSPRSCVISAKVIRVLANLSVDVPTSNSLHIFGDVDWPALRPYMRGARPGLDVISSGSYVDLRAILKSFRQQAGSRPSVFKELLDRRVVKSSEGRKGFLRKLIALGIVYQATEHYYLETNELSKLGIGWHAVIDGVPTDAVLSFLARLQSMD
ncbi:hypothetical protein ACQPZA_23550 [Pseudonocardia xinjiangensis]|uniref:hypothetical protein n=1 Tax=Pseudonocardia xinjiangensis TaxID=75289 RepID=UPI003D93617F